MLERFECINLESKQLKEVADGVAPDWAVYHSGGAVVLLLKRFDLKDGSPVVVAVSDDAVMFVWCPGGVRRGPGAVGDYLAASDEEERTLVAGGRVDAGAEQLFDREDLLEILKVYIAVAWR